MRDIVLATFLFGSIPFILGRPTIGVFLWVWVSVMSPHRLTFGFAQDLRFGYFIAIATLVGLFMTKEPKHLAKTPVTIVLALLVLLMNVSTAYAIDISLSLEMWQQVIKSMVMVFVALYILHSKQHINVLIWIVAGSVAFYGVKGGLFTLRNTGENIVWGPQGSFIEDNNALALATVMTIPLLYYLFMHGTKYWLRWGLLPAMVLCGFSVLGSHSRGAFIAIAVMLLFLWWNGHSKFLTGLVLALLIPVAIGFMPEKWIDRMYTIENYEQDGSAMGRINAWEMAFNVAKDRPVGGGFEMASRSVFARYAPDPKIGPKVVRAAHSIYFQVLGEHGFLGLALFLLLWILVWRDAAWIIKHTRSQKEFQWASDLARMIQVSLVGYFVGGAFLSLAYYDVPYNLLVAILLTRRLLEKAINSLDQTEEASSMTLQTSSVKAGSRYPTTRTRF